MITSIRSKRSFKLTTVVLMFLVAFTLLLAKAGNGHASTNEPTQVYIPLLKNNPRLGQVPELVTSVLLEGSRCPYDMSYNQHSGLLYITNEASKNVSTIHENKFAGNLPTGKWPKFVVSDPYSDRVYVSHVWDGIRILNGSHITESIPGYGESYKPIVNSINGYTYVTDLHHPITIIQGSKKIMDLFVPDFNGNKIEWQLAVDVDEISGLTYFASWQHGALSVIDGLEVTDQFSFEGEGASDLVIDPYRRLAIVSNNRARDDKESPNNISIVDLDSKGVSQIFSATYSQHVALDLLTGYSYVTNPKDDSVTIVKGEKEVTTYASGKKPWGVAVDSVTGFAYVTNADDNSINVYRDGMPVTTIELPEGMGYEPFHVTIDEESGRVFVLNRSSKEKETYPDTQVTICEQPWVHIFE